MEPLSKRQLCIVISVLTSKIEHMQNIINLYEEDNEVKKVRKPESNFDSSNY